MALRIMACMLLLEITAYLRETFQNLPKSIRTVGRDRPAAWDKSYMKDSNRRFSVALSSMGHSQASAQSLQSISCDRESSKLSKKALFSLKTRSISVSGKITRTIIPTKIFHT